MKVSSIYNDATFEMCQMKCIFIFYSARLASLFGRDQAAADHGNEFFQYTAPKQPKKGQGATATGKFKGLGLAPITLVESINSLPKVTCQINLTTSGACLSKL